MDQPGPFAELPILTGSDWAVNLTGVAINDLRVNITATKAVFDVNEKYIRLPKSDFGNLLPFLISNYSQCDICRLYTFCPSAILDPANLPSLTLSLGNYDFSLPAESYSYGIREGIVLAFRQSSGDDQEWTIGAEFLTEFFAYFNAETRSINITGGVPSPSPIETHSHRHLETWVMALIWALGSAVIGSFCCSMLLWKWKKVKEEIAYRDASKE